MGTDIHVYIETQKYDLWRHLAHVKVERDYCLFRALAGVRGEYGDEPLFPPRGFPNDASFITAGDYYTWEDDKKKIVADWHTPSWLTLEELQQIRDSYVDEWPVDMDAIMAMMRVHGGCRIVFWFDN